MYRKYFFVFFFYQKCQVHAHRDVEQLSQGPSKSVVKLGMACEIMTPKTLLPRSFHSMK